MAKKTSKRKAPPEQDSSTSEVGEWFKEKGIDLAQLALAVAALFTAGAQASPNPIPNDEIQVQQQPANPHGLKRDSVLTTYDFKKDRGKADPPHQEEFKRRMVKLHEILMISDSKARETSFSQFEKEWSGWIVTLRPEEQQQVSFDIGQFRRTGSTKV